MCVVKAMEIRRYNEESLSALRGLTCLFLLLFFPLLIFEMKARKISVLFCSTDLSAVIWKNLITTKIMFLKILGSLSLITPVDI